MSHYDCYGGNRGWSLDLVGYIQSISLLKLLSNLVNLFNTTYSIFFIFCFWTLRYYFSPDM